MKKNRVPKLIYGIIKKSLLCRQASMLLEEGILL
jgi:hypothetical protein